MDRSRLHGGPQRGLSGHQPPRGLSGHQPPRGLSGHQPPRGLSGHQPPRGASGNPPRGPILGSQTQHGPSGNQSRGPILGSQALRGSGGYHHQDARSNLAVQPAASTAKISLKKAAVKIVRPAAGAPPATSVAGPVKSAPKPEDGHETPRAYDEPKSDAALDQAESNALLAKSVPKKDTPAKTEPKDTSIEAELEDTLVETNPKETSCKPSFSTTSKDDAEAALDSLFSRLTSSRPAPSSTPTIDSGALSGLEKSMFELGDKAKQLSQTDVLQSYASTPSKEDARSKSPSIAPTIETAVSKEQKPVIAAKTTKESKLITTVEGNDKLTSTDDVGKAHPLDDIERRYLTKASEYLAKLPSDSKATTADVAKNVVIKLGASNFSRPQVDSVVAKDLRARYLEAVASYINGLHKPGAKQLAACDVRQILDQGDGDFLRLCATLVQKELLAIDTVDEIAGLCNAISNVLPKEVEPEVVTPATDQKLVSKDPMDNMATWPTQQKRENVVGCRTCTLKGVSNIKSIHQLQALVWGGRLESVSLLGSGSGLALVRFLTPEACQKYFDATENGIKMPGDNRSIVVVEKTSAPNSVNDVLRNCTEGDASRCVRALDVDDDLGDLLLSRLAQGNGQMKREVECIKRGKTDHGRKYIEFRFANILHALNFKRALMNDEDWEHCTIAYAPDPCEIASNVHFDDEDDKGKIIVF